MKMFRGRVAVVTGAASGIGLALARRCASEGIKLVLADIEQAPLEKVAQEIEATGVETLAVRCDVSKLADVEALAQRTLDRFGKAHLLFNNAGVLVGGSICEAPLADFKWQFAVNTWGVLYGVRTFVPIMLAQDEECHIVNTSSMAGLTAMPFAGGYHMSKHAVLALSEVLYKELVATGSKIGVSVVCPELIRTGIATSERNRPVDLRPSPHEPPAMGRELVEKTMLESVEAGADPEVISTRVFEALVEGRFYVLPEGEWRELADLRLEDIRLGRNPSLEVPKHDSA